MCEAGAQHEFQRPGAVLSIPVGKSLLVPGKKSAACDTHGGGLHGMQGKLRDGRLRILFP